MENSTADRLKQLRKEAELTQETAARKIGISYGAIQSHEGGKPIGRTSLKKYARFYNVNTDWILTGLGEKRPGQITESQQPNNPNTPYMKGTVTSRIIEEPAPELQTMDIGRQFIEDINHLKVIYDYEDLEIINAIHSNLRIFNRTVQREVEVKELKEKVSYLEKENAEIRKENAELRTRVSDLEEKVEQLIAGRMAARESKKAANV